MVNYVGAYTFTSLASYRVTLQGSLANMNAQALGTDHSFTFTVDVLQ